MTRDEYERRKQRIEEQLRAGIELMESAYRAQAFPRLPATFTRRDVCAALGYEPDRGALYRTLQDLTRSGDLRVEERGGGQRATTYRKTGAEPSPAHG